jgi:antitoxin ParD1/3/4
MQEEQAQMPTTQSLNITLPFELAQIVKNKVLSGEYASESDVIQDGLLSLTKHDAVIEKWLLDEVVPTYDALMSDPSQSVSADEAWDILSAYMDKSVKNAAKK